MPHHGRVVCLHWWGMLQLANARLRAHFFTAFKEAPRKLLITLDWGEAKRMPIWWQTGAAFLASMASHSGCLAPEGAVACAQSIYEEVAPCAHGGSPRIQGWG